MIAVAAALYAAIARVRLRGAECDRATTSRGSAISFGALALVVSLASQVGRRGRALLAVAAVPFALAQWVRAVKPLLGLHNPSLRAGYFQPLLGFLGHADRPLGRVEVVPTAYHWEAAYVAVAYPLARGWERQLDTANNAIFYGPGLLNRTSYRQWLFANGVRFVALPDVQLDYAALAEGRLVQAGVPGLRLVWHNQHWRVFSVVGAPGVVSGPARLVSLSGSDVVINVARPGNGRRPRALRGGLAGHTRACERHHGAGRLAARPRAARRAGRASHLPLTRRAGGQLAGSGR